MLRRRRPLPILGGGHTHEFHKCADACHNACQREPSNPTSSATFSELAARMLTRRDMLKVSAAGATAAALTAGPLSTVADAQEVRGRAAALLDRPEPVGTLRFDPVEPNILSEVVVPDGYSSKLLIAWGDPLFPGAPVFDYDDPDSRVAEARNQWFGYNNDYVAFFPLRGNSSLTGLLWVNHEYVDSGWAGGGIGALVQRLEEADASGDSEPELEEVRRQVAEAAISAIGGSVIEIHRARGRDRSYSYRVGSPYNRRITADTPMTFGGPVRGSGWVRGAVDVRGTVGNCAGGTTPWGTVLTAEENFQGYFTARMFSEEALATPLGFKQLVDGELVDATVGTVHSRYGVDSPDGEGWDAADPRWGDAFEPFRFGYIVEVDPFDPDSTPKKRTALGRIKHEGAATSLTNDGRVVSYLGDDERFDYLYKFVTDGRYEPGLRNRSANMDLLDAGTLYVARFELLDTDIGTGARGRWIPLVPGTMTEYGQTLAELGWSETDIAAFSRGAADLVGATPMDRPEDVQRNEVTGAVYMMCTNNSQREDPNDPNPRAPNRYGHVVEIWEDGNDAGATSFNWVIPLAGGEPDKAYEEGGLYTVYEGGEIAPISSPDNCTFDADGNLWIATDGTQPVTVDGMPANDGFFVMPVEGPDRGNLQLFATVPRGAETCGPEFTPDMLSLFLAPQHPGAGWPDDGAGYGRPGVVSIWKSGRGDPRIGK